MLLLMIESLAAFCRHCPLLSWLSDLHTHKTRGSNTHNFSLSKRILLAPSSFLFTAIKEWNSLPAHIKQIDSESAFKLRLKAHLLSNYC